MTGPTLAARVADRAERQVGIQLRDAQAERLAQYVELLARWNRAINLTALPLSGFPDAALDRALMEPLAAAAQMPEDESLWFDLGSGGGTPAIPLKIVRPALDLVMVEVRSRKAAFLREAVRTLGLSGARVLVERFQTLDRAPLSGTTAVVTARGVRIDAAVTSLALELLKPGGRLLLFTSRTAGPPGGGMRVASGELREVMRMGLPSPGGLLHVWEKRAFHVER